MRPLRTNLRSFKALFPALTESPLKQRIRSLGERLDSHRKRQQEQHPGLTLTGIYNVLEKLRSGEPLTAKEKQIHDQGLVTVLRQIHDELDEAVLDAYGWGDLSARDTGIPACSSAPGASSEEAGRNAYITELLTRLVALNHERAAEEKRGLIRWLRPDYQNPTKTSDGHRPPLQGDLSGTETDSSSSNQKSKINNPQSTPLRLSSGPTACRIKSRPFASSSAPATRRSPLLMLPKPSPSSSAARARNAPTRLKEFWRR